MSDSYLHIMRRSGGGGGGRGSGPPPPLKNHKNIRFLSNSGPDPLKNHQHASETLFKWRFAGDR